MNAHQWTALAVVLVGLLLLFAGLSHIPAGFTIERQELVIDPTTVDLDIRPAGVATEALTPSASGPALQNPFAAPIAQGVKRGEMRLSLPPPPPIARPDLPPLPERQY